MREAMVAMSAAGIVPARVGRVHPRIAPVVLDLPNWLFRIVAASMLKIDAQARSSMAEDLEAGRKPEIGYLNGEIVRLGESTGTPTPVNTGLTELVMQAFSQGTSPRLSGGELAARLGL
ncbi:MAG: ketopantoate reductase C-terminal domain-containing protein, partial [Pseudomonadota bacterium]|nr:ketopantoate reductase C-terminal domain-containing protein [Pseudomonadota bacterium]